MSNCTCNGQPDSAFHTNAFVNLNGMPYLLAEYLDRRNFQQVDRSLIKSEVNVDQTESMRAIIDISIDDIGKRASDGKPNIIGNNTKQRSLLEMIQCNYHQLEHQLPVLRRGIVLRVNYQLENYRTGQVIRTMVEDLRIADRNYFLDINPRDINDNAIVVNFSDTKVSTINEFTHGMDPMIFRITNVQMCYECVRPNPMMPRIQNRYMPGQVMPTQYGSEAEMYRYHQQAQSHQFIGTPNGYGNEDVNAITSPNWTMFNRFYHFDNNGRDVILHNQEIYDQNVSVVLLACGTVKVGRSFTINPGHRIVFKFSVWKNDVAVVNDTTEIAKALKAAVTDPYYYPPVRPERPVEPPPSRPPHQPIYPDMETLLRMFQSSKQMDYEQNAVINRLNNTLEELKGIIREIHGGEGEPSEEEDPPPILPELPDDKPPCPPPPPHHGQLDTIMTMLNSLQTQINELKGIHEDTADDPTYTPIPTESITDTVDRIDGELP